MLALKENIFAEINVQGSKFLSEAFIVESQDEARKLLKEQKQKYADSTHVVHAFVVGPTGGILGSSDDGEPSGTAGRPVLDVLKGSGITNIMLTVTRWFGGTLLGTGGLVKAYGDSAKAVLKKAKTAKLTSVRDFSVEISYELYEKLTKEIKNIGGVIKEEIFEVQVKIKGIIAESQTKTLKELTKNISMGKTKAIISKEAKLLAM